MSEIKKVKKINDVKKTQRRPVVIRSTEASEFRKLAKTPEINNAVPERGLLASSEGILKKTNTKKVFFHSIKYFFKLVLTVAAVLFLGYITSELLYRGVVTINIKKQILDSSTNISVIPNDQFTKSENTLPYYVYISDRVITQQELEQGSSDIITLLQKKLPADAIIKPEYLFIKNSDSNYLSTIFFKKSDIAFFLGNHKIDTTYHNQVADIQHVGVTLHESVNSSNTMRILPASLYGEFTAQAVIDNHKILLKIADTDSVTCTQVLQGIPEITVDRCGIFPPWYKKIPKNTKFIHLIIK